MVRFSEDKIQQIRDRVNLVELVGSYVSLKQSGRNHWGLCPFHNEKTPSFSVSAEKQIFKCFGCGAGGDAFDFLMKIEGLSFPEAVKKLAEQVGVEIEERPLTPEEDLRKREREHLLRINEVVCAFYQQVLLEAPEGETARRYLKKRGYDRTIAETYRLGFAPDGWENLAKHLSEKGFEPDKVKQLGLIREGKEGRGDYDQFRRRLMFPILGLSGQVQAFGGRVLDDSLPKYINSTESPVYHKGRILFGLQTGRQAMRTSGEAIVVEGYFDQMALHRAGYPQAVATCGTALTEEHAALLKRYASKVFLLFDQDAAGQKATFRAMEPLLVLGMEARVVALPGGEDPDSYLAENGKEAFGERLKQARPVVEAFVDFALAEEDGSIEGKVRAAHRVMDKLALLPDAMTRGLYVRMLAERTGIDEGLLKEYRPKRPPARSAGGSSKSGGSSSPAMAGGPPEMDVPPPVDPGGYGAPPEPMPILPETQGGQGRREARSGASTPPSQGEQRSPAVGKAEQAVLRLMLALSLAREAVQEAGLDQFFDDRVSLQLARRILESPAAQEEIDPAPLSAGLEPEEADLLNRVQGLDLESLAEAPETFLNDCRLTVRKRRLQQEIGRMQQTLSRLTDESEKADCLQQLMALKKELAGG